MDDASKLHEIGPCSQNLLGRHTAMDAATIKGIVDRLLTRGLIEVGADPSDSRRDTITMTGKGKDFVRSALPLADEVTRETLAPLTPDEQETILDLIGKLR